MNIADLLWRPEYGPDEAGITCKPVIAWAMNDAINEDGIESQLLSFKRIGYGGVMVLPWGGLPYEFLSDEWLSAVKLILDHAQKLGLEVWMWDDWLFPSGFAGGKLGCHDKYKAKKLRLAIDVVLEAGESFSANFPLRAVAAGIFDVDKYLNPCALIEDLVVKPGEQFQYRSTGRCRLMVVSWDYVSGMQNTIRSHSYFLKRDKRYSIYTIDDMDAFSTDILSKETAEQYLQLIHEKYWNRMPEHFGKTLKGFFFDEPAIPTMYPWNDKLKSEFQRRKGYDITPYLVQIIAGYKICDVPFDIDPEDVKNARADYNDVWSSLFAENFYSVIQKWCHEHNVMLIGHQGNDHSLEATMTNSGVLVKNMEHADIPGIDVVFNQVKPDTFTDSPRFAGSMASVAGKRWALTESYAAYGHGIDLDEMRFVADHQVIRGINKFIVKLANYNAEKSFYFHPPELSEVNPIIKHYGQILCKRIEDLSRIAYLGKACYKSCVLLPMNSFYRGDREMPKVIDDIARRLTYSQMEFDYVRDESVLDMHVADGFCVSAGGQKYSHIVIPPNASISEAVIKKLRSLADHGCSIILCYPCDNELVGAGLCLKNVEELPLYTDHVDHPFAFDSVSTPVSVSTRLFDDCGVHFVMLLNESSDHQELRIRRKRDGWLYEADLLSGRAYVLEADNHKLTDLKFAPRESKILVFSPGILDTPVLKPVADTSSALLLDSWTVRLPDGKTVHLHSDLPSWDKLGWPEYSGFMRYSCEFYWSSDASAVLSLGRLCYAASVYVDETLVGASLFSPHILLLDDLKQGKHMLTIDVLNTPANAACGSLDKYREMEEQGLFAGTYAPIYIPNDMKKLRSGLLGPVSLSPVVR